MSGKMVFDAGELESAISSVIFEIVEREKSVSSAASQVRCTSVVSNATVVFLCHTKYSCLTKKGGKNQR